jgi:hypothetical protein
MKTSNPTPDVNQQRSRNKLWHKALEQHDQLTKINGSIKVIFPL